MFITRTVVHRCSTCLLHQVNLGTKKLRNVTAYYDPTVSNTFCAMAIITDDGKTTAPQPELAQGYERSAAHGRSTEFVPVCTRGPTACDNVPGPGASLPCAGLKVASHAPSRPTCPPIPSQHIYSAAPHARLQLLWHNAEWRGELAEQSPRCMQNTSLGNPLVFMHQDGAQQTDSHTRHAAKDSVEARIPAPGTCAPLLPHPCSLATWSQTWAPAQG